MIESLEKLFVLKGLDDITNLRNLDLYTKNLLLSVLEPVSLPNSEQGFQKSFSRDRLLERINTKGFGDMLRHRFDEELVAEYLQALHLVETEIKTERGSTPMNMVLCQSGRTEDVVIEEPFLISATKITIAMAYLVENDVFIPRGIGESQIRVDRLNPTEKHNLTQCTVPAHMTMYQVKHFCNHLSELHGFVPYYKYVRSRNSFDEIEGSNGYYLINDNFKWNYAAFANTTQEYIGTDEPPISTTSSNLLVWDQGITNPPRLKSVSCINSDFSLVQYNNNYWLGVANKKPNAWGLYDMLGLALEMIDDYAFYEHYDSVFPIAKGGRFFDRDSLSDAREYSIEDVNYILFDNSMDSFRVARNPFAQIPTKAKAKKKL